MKSLEERVTEVEDTLSKIKEILVLQKEKAVIDQEIHNSLHGCMVEIAKNLGVNVDKIKDTIQ